MGSRGNAARMSNDGGGMMVQTLEQRYGSNGSPGTHELFTGNGVNRQRLLRVPSYNCWPRMEKNTKPNPKSSTTFMSEGTALIIEFMIFATPGDGDGGRGRVRLESMPGFTLFHRKVSAKRRAADHQTVISK